MPYIAPNRRPRLDKHLGPLRETLAASGPGQYGDLAYCLLSLCVGLTHDLNGWDHRSSVLKAVHSAGHEYERKHLDSYEDSKLVNHGDVT